jgi:tetratricopeptide (TPR) repeat protein
MKKLLFILLFIPVISFAQTGQDTSKIKQTYLTWARDAWKYKDYKTCIEDYSEIIKIDPKNVLAYDSRASAKWALKNDEGAIKDLDTAISLNDKYTWIYYNKVGLIKMDEKDFNGAIIAYTESIKLYSVGSTYNNRGVAELAAGNYKASIKDFTIAINRDNSPTHKPQLYTFLYSANKYVLRAKAEMLYGDTKKAIFDLDTAININAKLPLAYNARGEAKNKLGDKAGACADWQTASYMGCEPAKQNLKQYGCAN